MSIIDYVIKKFELKNKSINIINYEGHVTLDVLFNLNRSIDNKSNYYFMTFDFNNSNHNIINSKIVNANNRINTKVPRSQGPTVARSPSPRS